jgi:hypothetical protein
MLLTTAALISAGAGLVASGLGAGMGAYNTKKARQEENKSYQQAKNYLSSQYYRDPLSTVGNRALLKNLDERMKDSQDALNNRAVAGGATFENQLAARQSANETMGNVYTNLLQGEDARKDRLAQQQLGLDMQHSQNIQNSYLQNAQNWQAWGSAMGNSAMDAGSTLLYGKMNGLNTVGDLFKTT